MVNRPCRSCGGSRLQPVPLAVKIGDCNIAEITREPVGNSLSWVTGLEDETRSPLTPRQRLIAKSILKDHYFGTCLHQVFGFSRSTDGVVCLGRNHDIINRCHVKGIAGGLDGDSVFP
mgnify:CR=1 FL=1